MSTRIGEGRDDGAARDTRARLCTSHAWCAEWRNHPGDCTIAVRAAYVAPDYGPTRKR